jgi:5-methylcytosine-specific restriction endonuclease McrA
MVQLAVFHLVRIELSTWWGLEYHRAKQRFFRKAYWHRCGWCHNPIAKKKRSVDHIIPRWIFNQLGLIELAIDPDNFQIMHKKCNVEKGGKLTPAAFNLLAQKVQQYRL